MGVLAHIHSLADHAGRHKLGRVCSPEGEYPCVDKKPDGLDRDNKG